MAGRRVALGLLLAIAAGSAANAASTDVVFKGGLDITNTSGCTGWDPVNQFFLGTYWIPVTGSTNGPDSVLTMHSGDAGAEGFYLPGGVFTSLFKTVQALHIFTRTDIYSAFVKVSSQTPAAIATTTQKITVNGQVKGFGSTLACIVTFAFSGVRDLQP